MIEHAVDASRPRVRRRRWSDEVKVLARGLTSIGIPRRVSASRKQTTAVACTDVRTHTFQSGKMHQAVTPHREAEIVSVSYLLG